MPARFCVILWFSYGNTGEKPVFGVADPGQEQVRKCAVKNYVNGIVRPVVRSRIRGTAVRVPRGGRGAPVRYRPDG